MLEMSNMGSTKKETVEKIEVASASNSKPPQFNGKKGDKYLMWKMKFEADQTTKDSLKCFNLNLRTNFQQKKKWYLIPATNLKETA